MRRKAMPFAVGILVAAILVAACGREPTPTSDNGLLTEQNAIERAVEQLKHSAPEITGVENPRNPVAWRMTLGEYDQRIGAIPSPDRADTPVWVVQIEGESSSAGIVPPESRKTYRYAVAVLDSRTGNVIATHHSNEPLTLPTATDAPAMSDPDRMVRETPSPNPPSTPTSTLDQCAEAPEPAVRVACERIKHAGPGEVVPGFGGLFLDAKDNSIVYVYMLDPTRSDDAERAARSILGPERFAREVSEVRILQGQYSWGELERWYREAQDVLYRRFDSIGTSDIDEKRNRIVFGVTTEHRAQQMREALARETSIPQEAVIFEAAPKTRLDGPPVLLEGANGMRISLEFPGKVRPGEALPIDVVLTNTTDHWVKFDHGKPFHENVMVYTADGDEIWQKLRGLILVGTGGITRLHPGGQVTLPNVWNQRDQDGSALPPGRYLVRASVHIIDFPGGTVRVMDLATEAQELVILPPAKGP